MGSIFLAYGYGNPRTLLLSDDMGMNNETSRDLFSSWFYDFTVILNTVLRGTGGAKIIKRNEEYKSTVKYHIFVLLRIQSPRGFGCCSIIIFVCSIYILFCSIISGTSMISIAHLYTVHNYTYIYIYTVDNLLGKPHNVFILCTYICIILCICLGPQKKVTQKPEL